MAFAVGISAVGANAKEAPDNPHATGSAGTVRQAADDRGIAHKKIATDRKGRSVISLERESSTALAGIDMEKTSSITATRPPELVAKTGKADFAGFADIIARHASANGVPVSLARAVIRVESNFRVNARGRAGEVGLMQIKPATARGLGYTGSTKGLYDPETNVKWGMKYLGMAHKLGGGATCATILKYNAGHAAKRMNPVSAAYCSKVKRHLAS